MWWWARTSASARGGRGTRAQLKALGAAAGFGVTVAPLVSDGAAATIRPRRSARRWPRGGRRRRRASSGTGTGSRAPVQHGDKRGRALGFPTANLVARRAAPAAVRGLCGAWWTCSTGPHAGATPGSPRSGCGRPSARTPPNLEVAPLRLRRRSLRRGAVGGAGRLPAAGAEVRGRRRRWWRRCGSTPPRRARGWPAPRARDAMLETDRLILRRWEARDLAPFAALNADPEVMRHFPEAPGRARRATPSSRGCEDRWRADGIGFAVAERKADGAFIGMVGLSRVRFAPLRGGGRDRLAAGAGALGAGICYRGGARLAGTRLRRDGARGDHRLHGAGEHGLAAGDGAARDAARPGARLRASGAAGGARAAAAPGLALDRAEWSA